MNVMGAAGRVCLLVASVAMCAACGQRSDLAGPCDEDTEASGGSYFCVGERLEQEPEVVEEEKKKEDMPASADQPTSMEEEEEPVRPDPSAPPSSYPLDARGFPVPTHAQSFIHIEMSQRAACVLDEFQQLFCWELEFEEDGQIRSKLEGQERIERFYDGQTHDVALDGSHVCVEDLWEARCKRFDDARWRTVLQMEATRDDVSPLSMKDNVLCGLHYGRPLCAPIEVNDSVENTSYRAAWLEWEEMADEYFTGFDLRNLTYGRNVVFCALTNGSGVYCQTTVGGILLKNDHIEAQTGSFADMQTRHGAFAALRLDGVVEVHFINTWSHEGMTREETYMARVTPEVERLYSNTSALTTDGEVIHWNHEQVRDMFASAGLRTTVRHRVLDIETPKSFDVASGHWKLGEAWCSLNARSEVSCGYFPTYEDW